MGSRAIVIVCQDDEASPASDSAYSKARRASVYTRTAGDFSNDAALEARVPRPVQAALDGAVLGRFNTNWVCLDCELMPWSAKALELVRQQYASVGTAARVGLGEAVSRAPAAQRREDRCRSAARATQDPPGSCRTVRAGVSALLLAGRIAARYPHCPVSRDGDRRRGAHRQGSRVAHEHDRQLRPARRWPVDGHAVSDRRPGRSRERGGCNGLVGDRDRDGGEGAVVKPLSFVATGSVACCSRQSSAAGAEYSGSSTGPSTRCPSTSRDCASVAFG